LKPILKWQYDQIIKELLLLQQHAADESCPCHSDGERCVRKHLFLIEACAQETIPIEENQEYKDKLEILAAEAKTYRQEEEKALCGKPEDAPHLLDWARDRRKEFGAYSLSCDIKSPDIAEQAAAIEK
jgi:hypothetical protein